MTSAAIHVHFLPTSLQPRQLTDGVAVVIDVLRASSTIITAIHNGAECVLPCETVESARQIAEQFDRSNILLGGERGGVRLSGFDAGNSPAEYSAAAVRGRRVVFTTTNGTQALLKSTAAESILVGAFVNLTEVRRALIQKSRSVHLVCAGTDGDVTGEDALFAGAVVWSLTQQSSKVPTDRPKWQLSDSARIALSFWDQKVLLNVDAPAMTGDGIMSWPATLSPVIARILRQTHGGRNLLELQYEADVDLCSQVDSVPVLPEFNATTGEIRTVK